jgi:hypothetical protein
MEPIKKPSTRISSLFYSETPLRHSTSPELNLNSCGKFSKKLIRIKMASLALKSS